jgi:SOS-response transcriptional repressor LexA
MRYARPEEHLPGPRFAGGTVGAMTLGQRLRAAIDAKNKSHAWVAEEVGITPASLSAILTGKTADPSFFTVLAIARAIGEPLSAIVDDPLEFWRAEELERLREAGEWLVVRTTREHGGNALEIPPRKKFRTASAQVHPVAATSGGVLYPDAFELPRRRIPVKYARLHADAVFSVSGESMTGEDILPGDLLYVRRTPETADAIGRIVVCSVDDMVLVKRLRTRGRRLLLESAHASHQPMLIDESSSRFRLIGIMVGKSRT